MKRSSFTDLVLALVLTIFALGAYFYWYASLTKASVAAAELASRIAEKSEDASRIIAAKSILVTLSSDETAVRGYFVSTEDVVPFLEGLEETGRAFDARVSVASVSAGSAGGRNHLLVAVKVNGVFDAVLRALGAIEYGPYDIAIVNLSFDAVSDETSEWEATATFAVGTHLPTAGAAGTASP